jgi:acetyltransferase-like isoleucine patch superfamily enzyme
VPTPSEIRESGFEHRHPRLTSTIEPVAAVAVAPLVALLRFRLIGFKTGGQLLSLVPGGLGLALCRAWYRATLAECGERLRIGFGTFVRDPMTRFGDDCYLGDYVGISLAWCGSDVIIAEHVTIQGRGRRYGRRDRPLRVQTVPVPTVRIGDDAWIASGARVLADVAAHSIVAAGAVVVDSFPEWSVLGGVPARVMFERPGGSGDAGPDATPDSQQPE